MSTNPYASDASSHSIRPIVPADLEIIREIDRDAFETYRREHRQLKHNLQLRSLENMDAAVRRENPGVVIEWPSGHVVGYCFTHIWGSLGWLGTLGIAPRYQGFGLGRAIVAAGLDVLRQNCCRILALETMPESGKNLALYTRLGLEARQLTLLCQGSPRAAPQTHFEIWSEGRVLRDIASCLLPDLDPTPAAKWLIQEEAGETLIWWANGTPVAFAALRALPRRLESMQAFLTVEAAACLPEFAHLWPSYLSEMQTYARSQGKIGVVLPVNARQTHLLHATLDAGLQIVHTRVQMASGDPIGAPDAILMMTLAM